MERKLTAVKSQKNWVGSAKDTSVVFSPKIAAIAGVFGLKPAGTAWGEKTSGKLGTSLRLKSKGNLSTDVGTKRDTGERTGGQTMHSPHSSASGLSYLKVSEKHASSKSFVELSLTYRSSNHAKPVPILVSSQAAAAKPAPRSPHSADFPVQEPKPKLPLLPADALKHYSEDLTEYEQREITEADTVYFVGVKIVKARNEAFDNENGDYILSAGDQLAFRYEVLCVLGKGAFGVVAKCVDHKRKQEVAVKVIKNKKAFLKQGLIETRVLQAMRERDIDGIAPVVAMKSSFMFRKHLCISFELLSISLYDFMRGNRFQGLAPSLVRKFAVQLLKALIFIKKLKIIHCDLKPENVLLKTRKKAAIKVIDFGSSCFESSRIYTYIQSRFYRAPEIILGAPYTCAIDMWSFGCILYELARGSPPFTGENEKHQLGVMMEVLGVPPNVVMARSPKRALYFDSLGAPRIFHSSKGRPAYPNTTSLSVLLQDCEPAFIDLISKCLDWNPMTRLTPDEAIRHPWINTGEEVGGLSRTMSGLSYASLRLAQKGRKVSIGVCGKTDVGS